MNRFLAIRLILLFFVTGFAAGPAYAGLCKRTEGTLRSINSKQLRVTAKDGKTKTLDATTLSAKTRSELATKTGQNVKICIPMKARTVASSGGKNAK